MPCPIGNAALREMLGLRVPPPAVESYVIAGARRTEVHASRIAEFYPKSYLPQGSVVSHLKFALRHEPVDLAILIAALKEMDRAELIDWIQSEPTGAYSRRAWFFYETFTGNTLELPAALTGNFVPALDPRKHFVAGRRLSARHRVVDNLLGGPGYCPTIRRTPALEAFLNRRLDEEARTLVQNYDPTVLARAISYLYTKETRSSFAIEGETLSSSRNERFVNALRAAGQFDATNKSALVQLQASIVEPRYAALDWRTSQIFVGETVGTCRERVHFIGPLPERIGDLMTAWMSMTRRVIEGPVDPVIAAALVAFGFVFLHPFEDGNGRMHRFLIHNVLARREFSPPDMIFPVSAAILRQRHSYDEALETFSRPLFEYLDWRFSADGEIVVANDVTDLYRYFDATQLAEYLYNRVADTVGHDLKEELDFVSVYDRALAAVIDIIDMPDRRASLFVRLCMQNGGRLARSRREQFSELSDEEIRSLETAIKGVTQETAASG